MTKNTQSESYESREGTSDFRLQTSDFRLQTFDFRLPEIFLNKFFINFFKNFFNKKTSGQHTATDLVNFVYYPTGFV